MARRSWIIAVLAAMVPVLFLLCLSTGSVPIPLSEVWRSLTGGMVQDPTWATIVSQVRLPEAWTALLAGAGLAAGGLMMQTLFRNPLAGPDVLGITSGSSLGVALVMLAQPFWAAWVPQEFAVLMAAALGAFVLLGIIVGADRRIGDGVTLLIIGLMIGYVCGAIINVLQSGSAVGALKGYVMWGMGSFAGVPPQRMAWLAMPVVLGLGAALCMIKPLNALLLGADHATSVGVRVRRARGIIICSTGLLAGAITAFCGPIAFLGLATPHIARALLRTADHARLMPATILCGAALGLLCDFLVRASGPENPLPLNAITSLLGAPVVIWVLLSGKRWSHGN